MPGSSKLIRLAMLHTIPSVQKMMETKETIEKPPNPVNVTPPIAASLLSGMDVAFVEALVSTTGAAVEVIVPP
jgi:hypothetical protein